MSILNNCVTSDRCETWQGRGGGWGGWLGAFWAKNSLGQCSAKWGCSATYDCNLKLQLTLRRCFQHCNNSPLRLLAPKISSYWQRRCTEISPDLLRSHKIYWDLTRCSEISPDLLRSPKIYWDLTRSTEISPDVLRSHKIDNWQLTIYNW